MEYISSIFYYIYYIANLPIVIFSYTITLWQILLYGLFGALIIWFIRNVFNS